MELDKFLKSHTFKTGAFVLIVLFILLIVFKLGVLHGYKKAIFPHRGGFDIHRSAGDTFFGHQRGAINKDVYKAIILKKQLNIEKEKTDAMTGAKSSTVESVE